MKSLLACALAFLVLACQVSPNARAEAAAQADTMSEATSEAFFLGQAPAPAEARAQPALATPSPEPAPAAERQVIYSAALRLVVVSAREAFASIRALAKESGGHLQESDAHTITIRVPAAAFEDVLARISTLGEVLDSNIRAADVTEEMLDLGIRLENARRARERLLEHLTKSDKVEDTLKIELELTRVSEEIERIEGRLRFMQSQIALSTIRVELNTLTPERATDGLELPFDWIARLGDGLLAGTVQGMPRKPRILARGPRFDPPTGFVRYYSSRDLVEAMDADGLRIKLQLQDNYDEGALAFWSKLARRTLVTTRGLAVSEERDLGEQRTLLLGTREVANQPFGYLLMLARTKSDLYTFEAWGPQDAFERALPALIESAQSLRR